MSYCLVYITTEDEDEAMVIGRILVEENLAACVNIHPIHSIYRWEGDVEEEAEINMLASSYAPLPFNVEILKVGHHGSRTACSEGFLFAVSPEVAIYMAEEGNSYGHPHEETIQALNNINAEIYGTDIFGTIVVTTDGVTYEVQTEKN